MKKIFHSIILQVPICTAGADGYGNVTRMVVYAITAISGIIMVIKPVSGMEWIIALAVAVILILVECLYLLLCQNLR